MAAFFESHGYSARCNAVLEGRSGGRHEVDVLVEKADALTTYRAAVECKAWQHPIEKDVVTKLHYVLSDVGLHKGIVVSLAGCRSGAQQAAEALGIELWGPDELRRHLGDAAVGALAVPPAAVTQTHSWGLRVQVPRDQAEVALRESGKGRFNLRVVEHLAWVSLLWLPVYCVRLNVVQPDTRRLRQQPRSTVVDNLYEAVSGEFLGTVRAVSWEQVQTDQRLSLRPALRDAKVHAALRKAVDSYARVSSPAAVERHATNLSLLGIPTPCHSIAIEETWLVHLPYYAGVLQAGHQERVAAVEAWSGTIAGTASRVLTANLAQLRAHFAGRR